LKGRLRLDEVKPEDHEWIWADRIARQEIHFIAGRPDTGKGIMLAKIVSDVSLGRDPFTNKPGRSLLNRKQPPLRPMNILYSAAEDGAGTMTRPRLEAMGAKRSNIHMQRFRLPIDFEELADAMISLKIDLLAMDPLASHLSSGVNRYGDSIRLVTDPLKELLEITNAACIVVDHVRKHVGPNSDPLTAVGGGSSGFPAACRMGFLFGRDPDDEDRGVLGCIKHNIREKPMAITFELDSVEVNFDWKDVDTGEVLHYHKESVPKLITQGEDFFNPIKLVVSNDKAFGIGRKPADKRAQACEWLTQYLFAALMRNDGTYPVHGKQIQEDAMQTGMAYRTLRRAADDMKIVKSGRGGHAVTWALPAEILAMLTGEIDEDPVPEVAADPVEEPGLTHMLDAGMPPSGDAEDWERNKPKDEVDKVMDEEFDSFLANLGDGEEGGDVQA
jgi:putative DNA primase/helicase